MHKSVIASILILFLATVVVSADPPPLVNYQGYLTNSSDVPVADDTYSVTFTIYDALTLGESKWTETQSITTDQGRFAVLLGSISPISDSVFSGPRWLGVQVESDPEIDPRSPLVTVPYAFRVSSLDGSTGGVVSGEVEIDPVDGSGSSVIVGRGDSALILYNPLGEPLIIITYDASDGGGAVSVRAAAAKSGNAATTDKVRLSSDGIVMFGASESDTVFNVSADGEIQTSNSSGSGTHSVAFGYGNTVSGDTSGVGSGTGNTVSNAKSYVGGGELNNVNGDLSAILGGSSNNILGFYNTIGGGYRNVIGGGMGMTLFSFIGGGEVDTITGGSWGSVIGGGRYNKIDSSFSSFIGGGRRNIIDHAFAGSMIGGGQYNTIATISDVGGPSSILGGAYNSITDTAGLATIAGGQNNRISAEGAFIGGGLNNHISAEGAFIGGGGGGSLEVDSNSAQGTFSAILGGARNYTTGTWGVVAGGFGNVADSASFAAGYDAAATHNHSFVWSDGSAQTASTGPASFVARASGGYTLYTGSGAGAGLTLSAGGSSWQTLSDSTLKRNIREVDYQEILEKVAELPISRWSYEAQDESIEHVGPMAQDFHAAFGLGEDERRINTLDPDGIALAAIKALYEKSTKIDDLEKEVAELRALLEQLVADKD